MINLNELHVVEFSLSQKCFHLHSAMEMIKGNMMNIIGRCQDDWAVIGIFETEEDADKFIEKYRDRIKDYSIYKSVNGEMIVIP